MPRVCFFTVTCSDDYDFLLGSIERHAEMGRHLVLDTSPPDKAVKFSRLPESVQWVHEPNYGSGWKEFKLRTAVERACELARNLEGDVLIYLDSDEFYSLDSPQNLFPLGLEFMVWVNYTHWRKDGLPYMFGESEWHPRLWPRAGAVRVVANTAWQGHPAYNGNPEHHPVVHPPEGLSSIRAPGNFRHHLHYALGVKADEEETAKTTISGWPNEGVRVPMVPWPAKLTLWKNKGIRPSESFR